MISLPIRVIDDGRHRRVAELLVVLCVLSLADLVFTVWAHLFTSFYEMNPLARGILNHHAILELIVMKVALTGVGISIFWYLRKFLRAELALWVIVGVYVMLTFRWNTYTAEAILAPYRHLARI